jgi:SAM-dependent methyltransferase
MGIENDLSFLRNQCIKFLTNSPGGPFTQLSNLNWERHVERIKCALDYVPKKGKILDVGCGPGHTTCMSKIFRNDIKSFGFDIGKKYFWGKLENDFEVSFLINNAETSCFENGVFDVVISFGVIEHTRDHNKFLKEINRILKPRGYFFAFDLPTKYSFSEAFLTRIIQVFRKEKIFFHDKRYTKIEVENLFSRNGFSASVREQFFIPAQVDRVSGILGKIFNKNYKTIDKIDKLILQTPLKFFSQVYFVQARKL